jgi:hypothetical protein
VGIRISDSRVGNVRRTTIHTPFRRFGCLRANVLPHGGKRIERRNGASVFTQAGFERVNMRVHQDRQRGPTAVIAPERMATAC